MSKRVIAMALAILAFFLFVGSPFQQAAQAIAIVDDAIVAIIIAALAAVGITFTSTGAFNTLEDYVGSLLEDWSESTGHTLVYNLSGVNYGRNKLGQIVLNNRFVRLIQAFATWIKAKFSIQNNTTTNVVVQGYTINGYVSYLLPVSVYRDIFNNGSIYEYLDEEYLVEHDIFAIPSYTNNGNSMVWIFWSLSPGSVQMYEISPNGNTSNLGTLNLVLQSSGIYVVRGRTNHAISQIVTFDYTIQGGLQEIQESISNGQPIITNEGTAIDIIGGTMNFPYDDADFDEGDGAILDVGASWGEDLRDIVEQDIPENYQDSTITYDQEQSITDEYVEDSSLTEVSEEPSEYQVQGLQSVFPFCIPFDLYNFVDCLAADPVAPSFTWRFYVPGICDENIVIDLSDFDQAAQILRTMELLLFCVGLAFVTRKIIRG